MHHKTKKCSQGEQRERPGRTGLGTECPVPGAADGRGGYQGPLRTALALLWGIIPGCRAPEHGWPALSLTDELLTIFSTMSFSSSIRQIIVVAYNC